VKTPSFTFIDLFSGIGGFHHALSDPTFGGECVLAVDIDETCRKVYASSFPETAEAGRIKSDIREITLSKDGEPRTLEEISLLVPDHDVLCAGFPCQPFSKSGFQLGINDPTRGTLFFDIMQIVRAKKPRFLILENVRNLAGPKHTETWRTIVASLRASGYRVSDTPVVFSPHLLPPSAGGRPQTRDRVYILATRIDNDKDPLEEAPLVEYGAADGWNPHSWDIEKYLLKDQQIKELDKYRLREDEVAWLDAWQNFVQNIPDDSLPGFPIWVDSFTSKPVIPSGTPKWKTDIIKKNSAFYVKHKKFIDGWLKKSWKQETVYTVKDFPPSRRKLEWQARTAQPTQSDRDLWKLTIHFRPSGIRVKPATYLPALVAITQTSVIGARKRRITPIEAGRLQGIPDSVYKKAGVDDASAYKQVGNAVNVGAVQHVARTLFAASGLPWGDIKKGKRPSR